MAQKRDKNGQFVKGSEGGPGRPPRAKEERYFEAMRSACSLVEWRKIVKKAVEQAKRGNHPARKFLADYLLGSPLQRHELSGPDGGAMEHIITVFEHTLERVYGDDDDAA